MTGKVLFSPHKRVLERINRLGANRVLEVERVAELVKQATSDAEVLDALQRDPEQIRNRLRLSEDHLRALISAGAFSTARRAMTTSEPEEAMAGGILPGEAGTLLPPEGTGEMPGTGELPPGTGVTPVPGTTPTPQKQPRGSPSPGSQPGRHPPGTPGRIPSAPSSTPQAKGPRTPSAVPQAPAGRRPSDGGGKRLQVKGCCCACGTAMVAIVAQVSTTSQAAMTGITAIAGMD